MEEIVVAGATTVVVGRGVLGPGEILGDADPESCAVLSPPGASAAARSVVSGLAGAGIGVIPIDLPDGVGAKTLDVVGEVTRRLADGGLTRAGAIVVVGGGSATDVGGLIASLYHRGVPAFLVPTTLLAAVDAAIGGKTGVDLDGKNVIGTFRHPERVVIDLDVLEALPAPLLREGMIEALKTGAVADPALFGLLERDGVDSALEEVVTRSITAKAAIVGRDAEDRGERLHLNYGHTVGHAVEIAAGIGHGEAVAVGMVAAGRASALECGFEEEERQRAAIEGLGMPTVASVDRREVTRLVGLDKKRRHGEVRMVLLEAIGRPRVVAVGAATVDAALGAVGLSGDTA